MDGKAQDDRRFRVLRDHIFSSVIICLYIKNKFKKLNKEEKW